MKEGTYRGRVGKLQHDALWGARWGMIFGGVYCVWALVIFLLGGHAAFEDKGTTFGLVLIAYLGGGVASGCVVGLLRGWRRHAAGKVASAIVAALPVAVAIRLAIRGFMPWGHLDTALVIMLSLLWGVAAAVIFWRD